MLEGEYQSLKAIFNVVPSFVPRTYAVGKFQNSPPQACYLLTDFPDLDEICPTLHASAKGLPSFIEPGFSHRQIRVSCDYLSRLSLAEYWMA